MQACKTARSTSLLEAGSRLRLTLAAGFPLRLRRRWVGLRGKARDAEAVGVLSANVYLFRAVSRARALLHARNDRLRMKLRSGLARSEKRERRQYPVDGGVTEVDGTDPPSGDVHEIDGRERGARRDREHRRLR
jgi:hypothetical protein